MMNATTDPIHVALIEDHKGLRKGIEWMFESTADFLLTGSYACCEDAFSDWERRPLQAGSVVLMDIGLPGMSGVEGTRYLCRHWPEVQVITMTMHEDTSVIMETIQAGAVGYLPKPSSPTELMHAIRVVNEGGSFLTGQVALNLVKKIQAGQPVHPKEAFELSDREMEILAGLVNGATYKKLGEDLGISIDTVRSHIKKLYEKMSVHSRSEAVATAIRHGVRPAEID